MTKETQLDSLIETITKLVLEQLFVERKRLEINKIKRMEEPELRKFLRINGKWLGEGSSRVVYAIDGKSVLKMARLANPNDPWGDDSARERGIAQNEAEMEIYTNPRTKPIVAKVLDYHPEFLWLRTEIVRPLKGAREFQALTKMDFEDFWDMIDNVRDGRLKSDNSMVNAVVQLIDEQDLKPSDLDVITHWGKTADSRVVLLDYGATQDIIDRLY